MGLFGRKRKVGEAGIPGKARVVDVDTSDFWRDTPDRSGFRLGGMTREQFDDAIDGALNGGLLGADEAASARARVSDVGGT